jgi:hypothetical protein
MCACKLHPIESTSNWTGGFGRDNTQLLDRTSEANLRDGSTTYVQTIIVCKFIMGGHYRVQVFTSMSAQNQSQTVIWNEVERTSPGAWFVPRKAG